MKRYISIIILLFSFVLLFTSCVNAQSYYDEGNYLKTLELLKNKMGLTKNDYLMKIDCLVKLGRKSEAKESIMLYLLLSDESDDRTEVINMFGDYDFSSILTLLLLNDSDGLNAQVLRYIAYIDLKEYEKAKEILSGPLSSELSINQYATLLVAHPLESEFVYSFFNAWYKVIGEAEKSSFFSLFFYYLSNNELSFETAELSLSLLNKFDSDPFFKASQSSLSLLNKTKSLLNQKYYGL